jgi:tight adherence protein B
MLTALYLLAFVTAAVAAWLVLTRPDPLDERLLRYATGGIGAPAVRPFGQPAPKPLPTGVRLPKAWEAFLHRAGLDWTAPQALVVVAVYAVLGLSIGAWLQMPLVGALGGVVFLVLRLRSRQTRRITMMAEQLPDALMLMVSALKSGLGMQQAIHWVATEGAEPLSAEFGRLSNDISLGLSLEEALVRLQTRLGSTDGEMLSAALLVQRQTGGNLSEVLLNLHQTVRDRQAVTGQVQALTSQGKLTGVILTMLPFGVAGGLYAINKPYLMVLLTDPRGHTALGACAVMMTLAAVLIRRISHITL